MRREALSCSDNRDKSCSERLHDCSGVTVVRSRSESHNVLLKATRSTTITVTAGKPWQQVASLHPTKIRRSKTFFATARMKITFNSWVIVCVNFLQLNWSKSSRLQRAGAGAGAYRHSAGPAAFHLNSPPTNLLCARGDSVHVSHYSSHNEDTGLKMPRGENSRPFSSALRRICTWRHQETFRIR